MKDKDVFGQVERNIDRLAKANVDWSVPAAPGEIEQSRRGSLSILLSHGKELARAWFPQKLSGVKILCLAGAAGLSLRSGLLK